MMTTSEINYRKAPFPWFGGKADAAKYVWQAIGDVPHYVEPFAGSLAVLLLRPHLPNRTYYSETVADTDSLLCNFWRAIQFKPQETAEAASWPVSELDKHARGCLLLKWRESEATAHLAGDPTWCDPVIAGWWAWCVCVSIGGWGLGGPWWPDEHGFLRKRARNKDAGVSGDLPQISDNGRGVTRPQLRELGVSANMPHISTNGNGVNHAQLREPGVSVDELYQDATDALVARDYEATGGYHPMTMPKLRRWFAWLSARLRHVRVINGDWTRAVNGGWERAVTSGATLNITVRQGVGPCGIFFDPPYAIHDRDKLYGPHESFEVAKEVRQWCLEHGDDPRYRIVYAGFDVEGKELVEAGWREIEWFRGGYLKGGMGNLKKSDYEGPKHQQHRERLWLSPHCLKTQEEKRGKCLFDD